VNLTAERVVRGAVLLDEHRPDWRERVNVDVLNVNSVRRCPVGQAFGLDQLSLSANATIEWRAALVRLGSPPRGRGNWVDTAMYAWAVHHGFDSPYNAFAMTFDWDALNVAWRELLDH
jgi:hypothetical protein